MRCKDGNEYRCILPSWAEPEEKCPALNGEAFNAGEVDFPCNECPYGEMVID